MPATLDLIAARHFTNDLNERLRWCENGEGMMCNSLDQDISSYVQLCDEWRTRVNQWANAVFSGQAIFDQAIEDLLMEAVRRLLHCTKRVAARARVMEGMCYEVHGLDSLHHKLADLDYLLENWVSPRLAVSPAPRVMLPHTADQQVIEQLGKLPLLPADWRPSDPEQRAFFQQQRAKGMD